MIDTPFGANGRKWGPKKIAVIGPGIVGTPMAALLNAATADQAAPASVIVVQRRSPTSGWKVEAINRGESPIGGVEPALDRLIADGVRAGTLRATHDYAEVNDADVILVCVQTDKAGLAPDYGPLLDALTHVGKALQDRPAGHVPLLIIESTLAPSSMTTLIRDLFSSFGLEEGRDILLGNSPNRVMPGRLVERVTTSDKIAGGLHPDTGKLIQQLYSRIVTRGTIHVTNSLTAEIVKTLENAYRDVRIAFAAEIARYCDDHGIDFYQVRDGVNQRLAQQDSASDDANAIPSGGLLVPTIGVGGHCLPKDGILLWWRRLEAGADQSQSLILEARRINDESPAACIALAERTFGQIEKRSIALLGTAYRFDSEDTRNSPTLTLATRLRALDCNVTLHDPYVRSGDQNLVRSDLDNRFTNDLATALKEAELAFLCTAHAVYRQSLLSALSGASHLRGLFDGCNFLRNTDLASTGVAYAGIGRGAESPSSEFLDFVHQEFRTMERGFANELLQLVDFLNVSFAADSFNQVDFSEVQRLAGTCVTGCSIVDPGPVADSDGYHGFSSRLADLARAAADVGLHAS
jgi:UDP-N-acetyl-D-mannosaminuronic acid dehydrogenase